MLSGPHQKFAEGIASGMNGVQSYQAAYPNASYVSARAKAALLAANGSIQAEIAALRETAKEKAGGVVLTLARKLDFLSAVVLVDAGDEPVKMSDKLRALELHAKLSGELNDKAPVTGDVRIKVTIGG
jgi:hypothetical protein